MSWTFRPSNEAHPDSTPVLLEAADSHVQMVGSILAQAQNLEEASQMLTSMNHASTESIVIADGDQDSSASFEMTHNTIEQRSPEEGILFQTNHFVGTHTSTLDKEPVNDDSLRRYDRISDLLQTDTLFNTEAVQHILQDRVDPWSGEESPEGIFDDGLRATNGAFLPLFLNRKQHFYVASGGSLFRCSNGTGLGIQSLGDGPKPFVKSCQTIIWGYKKNVIIVARRPLGVVLRSPNKSLYIIVNEKINDFGVEISHKQIHTLSCHLFVPICLYREASLRNRRKSTPTFVGL